MFIYYDIGKEILPVELEEEEFDYGDEDESDGEEEEAIRYDDCSDNPNSDDNNNDSFLDFWVSF